MPSKFTKLLFLVAIILAILTAWLIGAIAQSAYKQGYAEGHHDATIEIFSNVRRTLGGKPAKRR